MSTPQSSPPPAAAVKPDSKPHSKPEEKPAASSQSVPEPTPPVAPSAPPEQAPRKSRVLSRVALVLLFLGMIGGGAHWYVQSLDVASTDDAYVNGHVTYVAPRVAGQVAVVLVDDNNRVHKGDLLVQLDKEPFEVQKRIAQAAVESAQAELVAARAEARGFAAEARTMRFALEHAIENVDNQVALLKSRIATMNSFKATEARAQIDYDRFERLVKSKVASKPELDSAREGLLVAKARVEEALQGVYQVRVSLGLPEKPEEGEDLAQVPENLDQTFSSVLQAQAALIRAVAQLGTGDSFQKSPRQMVADFYKRDPDGNIDRILTGLIANAPTVKSAEARVAQAQEQLEQAELNLRYTDVVAEIDGVVTRRNVNPGNNVVVGQNLMAVRSLDEIWVDANFKETQLADLRIGQPVDLEVDMYGERQEFKGRISGFTMGTGSTLALLPAQNATGNFVKVVQRLPVRIELLNYEPDQAPLFVGLSVEPRVWIHKQPTGPNAGKQLQPHASVSEPKSNEMVHP